MLNSQEGNDDRLEMFFSTPYDGEEGFLDELIERCEPFIYEDLDYIYSYASDEQKQQIKKLCNSDYLPEFGDIDNI